MKKLLLIIPLIILMMATGCFITNPEPSTQKPTAYIDSISPKDANQGEPVSFEGHGTDPASSIVAYRWRSDKDGELSAKNSFETSSLSDGTHTIYFKVQNERGAWSEEVTGSVSIAGEPVATNPTNPPVISVFNASPVNIVEGESSTLSWTVTGAATVTIDQGIGNVALSSTRVVSPATSTMYTLTASNTVGSTTASAQVMVTPVAIPPSGLPDLIIEDIARNDTTITYTIRNQGNADAGASISVLVIDGAVKANDPVDPLAAGESSEESFSYSYSCSGTTDSMTVRADKNDTVTESNESNNELTESWLCTMIIVPGYVLTLSPDLIITDIWKVSEITGDKIYYKIKNQGLGESGPSTTRLVFYPATYPVTPVALDNVGTLAPGQEVTRKFATYNWTGFGTSVSVKADYNEAVAETDETNNVRSEPTSGL